MGDLTENIIIQKVIRISVSKKAKLSVTKGKLICHLTKDVG